MIALLVALTFFVAVLMDHLINRQPLILAESEQDHTSPRPRLVPAVIGGFAVPDNLRYHPGHTWAVSESPDRVRVGIDDFAAKVAGDVVKIEIPERGQWIRQGQKIISLKREGRELDLVSPIEGTVVDINEEALRDPRIARNDPYGDGWLIAVNAPDAKTNFRNLLRGSMARKWMDDAATRLRSFAPAPVGAMAQDGGMAADSLINTLPNEEWQNVERELFLI
jgi:glycine cleavage system H lipoate-binding protein